MIEVSPNARVYKKLAPPDQAYTRSPASCLKSYTESVRLFVAIPLAETAQAELIRLADRLGSAALMRWSTPESWHITLQFLGSTAEQQYQCLVDRLDQIRCAPVPVQLGGFGVFERAGIFCVEVEAGPELAALERKVTIATAPCGFEAETRSYRPHITLARAKGNDRARQLHLLLARVPPKLRFSRFAAKEFLLYESHLSHAGSTYEVRRRFRLETGN